MTFSGKYLVSAILLFAVSGCGTETSADGTGDDQLPDPYGDTPGYAIDPFAGFGPVESISLPADGGEAVLIRSSVGLWSVQIAACGSMDAAQILCQGVSACTDEPVFVDHIGSYYKVRVGSYATSEDSAQLRERLRSAGYSDAWSVEREATP